jgi:hypothetical protein
MPDSPSVGCWWMVLAMPAGCQPISMARQVSLLSSPVGMSAMVASGDPSGCRIDGGNSLRGGTQRAGHQHAEALRLVGMQAAQRGKSLKRWIDAMMPARLMRQSKCAFRITRFCIRKGTSHSHRERSRPALVNLGAAGRGQHVDAAHGLGKGRQTVCIPQGGDQPSRGSPSNRPKAMRRGCEDPQ